MAVAAVKLEGTHGGARHQERKNKRLGVSGGRRGDSDDLQGRRQLKLAERAGYDTDRRTNADTHIPIFKPVRVFNGRERFAIDLESESRLLAEAASGDSVVARSNGVTSLEAAQGPQASIAVSGDVVLVLDRDDAQESGFSNGGWFSSPPAVLEFLDLLLASGAFDGKTRVFRQRPIPLGPPRMRLLCEPQSSSNSRAAQAGRRRRARRARRGRGRVGPPAVLIGWQSTGVALSTARQYDLLGGAGSGATERRRSRTDRAVGYTTALVLKTSWATGPMPLRGEPSGSAG